MKIGTTKEKLIGIVMIDLGINKKLEAKIGIFLKGKQVVIVDSSSSTRSIIKKLLSEMGMPISSIDIVPDYYQAVELIKEKLPTIIFCAENLDKKTAKDLLEFHVESLPNRENCVFIGLDKTENPVTASSYMGTELNLLIKGAVTRDAILKGMVKAFAKKVKETQYDKEIYKIKALIHKKELEEAKKRAEKAITMSEKPTQALFLKGQIHELEGDLSNAETELEKALSANPKHFQTISFLMTVYQKEKDYKKAQDMADLLLQNYPLAVERIPDVIRVCLANRKFDQLNQFADLISRVPELESYMHNYLAAALALCGKHLLNSGEKEEAIKFLRKSLVSAGENANVVISVGESFLENGLYEEASKIIDDFDSKFGELSNFKILELDIYSKTTTEGGHVLQLGNELLKSNIKAPKVYEIMINVSKQMKRRAETIEQIAFEAGKEHPELKNFFNELAA